MLDLYRIDTIASDLTILNGLIEKNGKTKNDYANQLVVNELSLHILLYSKSPYLYLIDEINRTISQMIEDGTIERIIFQFIQ